MGPTLPERDWKYLRSVHDELLEALCAKINRETAQRLQSTEGTEYAKYLTVYRRIRFMDKTVAECFDDWRRSTIVFRLMSINANGLLTQEHLQKLSPEARSFLERLDNE